MQTSRSQVSLPPLRTSGDSEQLSELGLRHMVSFRSELDVLKGAVSETNSPRVTKPSLASLSSLTARANLLLCERQRDSQSLESPRAVLPPLSPVPGELDFKRVIARLNRIAEHGGVDSRKLILVEGKSEDAMLEQDEWLYARVATRGKSTPLQITLKRSKGKLVTYTSRTVQEPTALFHDSSHRGDIVLVSDSVSRFKSQHIYVGFNAAEESLFSIKIQFGKALASVQHRSEPSNFLDDSDWMDLLTLPAKADRRPIRNFLVENAKRSALSPLPDWTERREATEKRRKEAIQRFHLEIKKQKTKALSILNRREIKQQERLAQAREHAAQLDKELREKSWLLLTTSTLFHDTAVAQIHQRKVEILRHHRRNAMARKVQRLFRRSLQGVSPQALALRRCCESLLLLKRVAIPLHVPQVHRSLIACMLIGAERNKIWRAFVDFDHKGEQ